MTVSAEATSIEVSRGGDLAYVIGVYTAASTDPKTKKVMVNIDNAEAPASAR